MGSPIGGIMTYAGGASVILPIRRVVGPADIAALAVHITSGTHGRDIRHRRRPAARLVINVRL
jgi:hypothetical protein